MKNKAFMVEEETGLVTEIPVEEVDKSWYRRPANFKLGQFDKDTESNREASLTVPDQSYTIREILDKFTRGLPLDIQLEGKYENPVGFSENDPEKAIDITDVEEQLTEVNKRIEVAKSVSEKAKKAEQKTTTKEEEKSEGVK